MSVAAAAAGSSAAAFFFIGMRVAPCKYLLSYNSLYGFGRYMMIEGSAWILFSALLFPLGWYIGERFSVKAYPMLTKKPSLVYYGGESERPFGPAESVMPAITLVSGAVNSGKTSVLVDILREEVLSGSHVMGILALPIIEAGLKTGFQVLDVATGEKRILATRRPERIAGETLIEVGGYHFLEENFNFALYILSSSNGPGVVFIDEAGPLELSGGGYADKIKDIISGDADKVYISVRSSCLERFIDIFLCGRPYSVICSE